MSERLDILLFGATGLVGRYGVKHLHRLTAEKGLKWGVAGRDDNKLRNMLKKVGEKIGDISICNVPIITADLKDEKSLRLMTSRTRVLLNACGPLRALGENVVKACIDTKTHYADVSAEEIFVSNVLLKYDEKARDADVFILNACGVDCVMYDLGLIYLQDKFPGTLNSVETFIKAGKNDPSLEGPCYNNSTWRSAIDIARHKRELKAIRAKVPHIKLPKLQPTLVKRKIPFKTPVEDGWAVPFATTDHIIMERTQADLFKEANIRPAQIQTYFVAKEFKYFFIFLFLGIFFVILVQFEAGRKILMRYASFFSNGLFGTEEPTEEICASSWCRITFVGKGWGQKSIKADEECREKPNREMVVQIKVEEAAYNATSLCLILAGITMATEPEKLPKKCGVRTSGIVFRNTSYIKQLEQNGYSFEIIGDAKI